MLLAAHQPNFIPWFPFFEKMHQADIFVILTHCQFEKNGYQNRCMINGKWITNPVCSGNIPIFEKRYTNGNGLVDVNMGWILAIGKTLGIDTGKIVYDWETSKQGTLRIIELCARLNADKYLTNPEAIDKYLDADLMRKNGIEIVTFESKNKKHVFEYFLERGIEGTRKLLNKGT